MIALPPRSRIPVRLALNGPRLPRVLDGLTGGVLIAVAVKLLCGRRTG